MAKEKDKEFDLTSTAMSTADILQLFAALQRDNAATMAEALAKLSPQYVSPEQKAFQVTARKAQKEIEINKIKARKREQKYCDHESGQKGKNRNGEGAFFGLKLSTGETIGVCVYCQGVISSINPDHQKHFRKINGTVAEAGQFSGLTDPIKSQLARLNPEERERVIETRAKYFATNPVEKEIEDDITF